MKIDPNETNGLTKKSVADCLQTRPIDRRHRLVRIRGKISPAQLTEIDESLALVIGLRFK